MTSRALILAHDPEFDPDGCPMRFRLTYEGRLEGNGSPRHKHEIRKALHPQLKRLWQVEPNLMRWRDYSKEPPLRNPTEAGERGRPVPQALAELYQRNGFSFVPLVTEQAMLSVGIDILFLRPQLPGGLIKSADIDNRLKTLFDGLRMPTSADELGGHTPAEGEEPFFVLLEDDRLISHLSVETDVLLEPTPSAKGRDLPNDARLVMTISLKPYFVTTGNLHFS
ncbi:MAG TPA: hypothetical protein VF459_09975 [Caulobacteraceae bacterium]